MVSKLIGILIAIKLSGLFAHENINFITTNVNPFEVNTSNVKLDHLSIFELPNEDKILFNVTHSPSLKHFTNALGVGYRRNVDSIGLGLNLYYMHTNQPKTLIHQISPGLEMFYKDLQVSYNLYIPTTPKRTLKTGELYHNILSEFGLRYAPRKDFGLGLLPSYDHIKKEWYVNTRFSYILNEKYEFAVCPIYRPKGFGCTLSFGVIFGMQTLKPSKPIHRSNGFVYSLLKDPKIYCEDKKVETPVPEVPAKEEEKEKDIVAPTDKPTDQEPFNWWKYIPFSDYKGMDYVNKQEQPASTQSVPLSYAEPHLNDLFFVPDPQILSIVDNIIPVESNNVKHYNPGIIENYTRTNELG